MKVIEAIHKLDKMEDYKRTINDGLALAAMKLLVSEASDEIRIKYSKLIEKDQEKIRVSFVKKYEEKEL